MKSDAGVRLSCRIVRLDNHVGGMAICRNRSRRRSGFFMLYADGPLVIPTELLTELKRYVG